MQTRQWLIFTDLDGTLLDHHNYSWQQAEYCLAQLKQQQIPVIANTSKTFAEMCELESQLQLNSPFITENGAAIYIPCDYFPRKVAKGRFIKGYWQKSFTHPKEHWLSLLQQQGRSFVNCYQGFSSLSDTRLAELTGLDKHQCQLAKDRLFAEPLHWTGTDQQKAEFVAHFEQRGAKVVQGGRFLHLGGKTSKGQAMLWLVEEFQRQRQDQCFTTIALGDSGNDVDMLNCADIAVRILSPVQAPPELNSAKQVYTSKDYGPQGWADSINHILQSHVTGD